MSQVGGDLKLWGLQVVRVDCIFEQNIFSNLKILDFGEFLSLSAFQNVRFEPRLYVHTLVLNVHTLVLNLHTLVLNVHTLVLNVQIDIFKQHRPQYKQRFQ